MGPGALAWAAFVAAMPEVSLALGGLGIASGVGVWWYAQKLLKQHAEYIVGQCAECVGVAVVCG